MRARTAATSPRDGVLVLSGYGLEVTVNRGHLCAEDGVGADRRRGRFPRADRELRRLVVLGHSGTISFDALRWLSDVGAAFVQIDSDGRVIAAAGPVGLQDARLRRAQAQAPENGRGLTIGRELVRQKLAAQRAVLDRLPDSAEAKSIVSAAADRLDLADTIERLRAMEAEGASAYWRAWAPVELRFARRDAPRVPAHWRRFGRRASSVTATARKATSPANALLNYLYAIVEAEARIAALAVGCDPGLGIMHSDHRSRDSLACDLMEPVRPAVDAWVLDLLADRTFAKSDFFETREGVCRLMPPLTRGLAETSARWAALLAPIAERVVRQLMAHRLLARDRSSGLLPTPLTQANRSAGRRGGRERRNPRSRPMALAAACIVCGTELARGRRRYCSACRPIQTLDAVSKAHEALRARRLAGEDPAHGGKAARRRGQRNAVVLRKNAAWEREQTSVADPNGFAVEIRPGLQVVPLAEMMRVTGLSRPYCASIRRGDRAPHPRHWEALRQLVW